MTAILQLFAPIDVVKMQALNKFMYNKGIGRIQMRLPKREQPCLYAMRNVSKKLDLCIYEFDCQKSMSLPDFIDASDAAFKVQIGKSLICLGVGCQGIAWINYSENWDKKK